MANIQLVMESHQKNNFLGIHIKVINDYSLNFENLCIIHNEIHFNKSNKNYLRKANIMSDLDNYPNKIIMGNYNKVIILNYQYKIHNYDD